MQWYKVEEKNSNCTPFYPQFQNSVGTLIGRLKIGWFGLFMAFNATFNNISVILWRSVLLVEEAGENH
jgi:hypothetical protein